VVPLWAIHCGQLRNDALISGNAPSTPRTGTRIKCSIECNRHNECGFINSGLANTNALFTMLIALGASTSVIVGKAMHSIGLGVSLIPIFIAPIIALMGWL